MPRRLRRTRPCDLGWYCPSTRPFVSYRRPFFTDPSNNHPRNPMLRRVISTSISVATSHCHRIRLSLGSIETRNPRATNEGSGEAENMPPCNYTINLRINGAHHLKEFEPLCANAPREISRTSNVRERRHSLSTRGRSSACPTFSIVRRNPGPLFVFPHRRRTAQGALIRPTDR